MGMELKLGNKLMNRSKTNINVTKENGLEVRWKGKESSL